MLQYTWLGLAAADVELFPDLPTILWTIFDFVILLWGLTRLLYRPLMDKVNDRERKLDALGRQADADREEAAKLRAASEQRLIEAKRQADGIVAVANRQAELLLTRAESDAKQQADAILAEAAAEIAIDREQARTELTDEAAELIVRAAGRIIEGFLGPERQRGLCDVALAEVARLEVDPDVPAVISAEVRTAAPLSPDEESYLKQALSERLHRDVRLLPVVDPGLIGGVAFKVGDHLIDGTVRAQLQRLYEHLTGKIWRWDNEHSSDGDSGNAARQD